MVDIPFIYVRPLQCFKKKQNGSRCHLDILLNPNVCWHFVFKFGWLAFGQNFVFLCPQLMPRIVVDSGTGLQLRELKLRRGAKGRVEDLGAICFWPIKTDSVHLYTYLFCCGTGAFTVGVILVLWLLLG